MSGADAVAWCGALAGFAAPVTIGTYAYWGGRHRPGYDSWRDDLTDLGDDDDFVARLFPYVNALVAVELAVFAFAVRESLDLPLIAAAIFAAAVNSLLIGLTPCERGCRWPGRSGCAPRWMRWVHNVAGGLNIVGAILVPIAAWYLLRDRRGAYPALNQALWLWAPAAISAVAFLVAHRRNSRARQERRPRTAPSGLFERFILWVFGYAWVVVASATLLTQTLVEPLVVLGVWLVAATYLALVKMARDPSPDFYQDDCQPNTLAGVPGTRVGRFIVRQIVQPERFADDLAAALRPAGDDGALLGATTANGSSVTLGLSARALRKLDLGYRWNAPYVEDAFGAGMHARAEALGDADASAPEQWQYLWRNPNRLHVAFWIVARNADALQATHRRVNRTFAPSTARVLVEKTVRVDQEGTFVEHFGFRDGVGTVWIDRVDPPAVRRRPGGEVPDRRGGGVLTVGGRWRPVALGEFVLGHRDETGDVFPVPSPPELFEGGTFMVVRKLEQDVAAFDALVADAATRNAVVGRNAEGIPLARPKVGVCAANVFTYGRDPEGYQCPRGAHVRRSNPRDALGFRSTLSARRRLIRRGMPYGARYRDGDPPEGRGLFFVAYNARISEQFEFVQSQWLNSGEAFGLGADPDLVAGQWPVDEPRIVIVDRNGQCPIVLAPQKPLVRTRGGEYFFVPSVPGLCYLAGIRRPDPASR